MLLKPKKCQTKKLEIELLISKLLGRAILILIDIKNRLYNALRQIRVFGYLSNLV